MDARKVHCNMLIPMFFGGLAEILLCFVGWNRERISSVLKSLEIPEKRGECIFFFSKEKKKKKRGCFQKYAPDCMGVHGFIQSEG